MPSHAVKSGSAGSIRVQYVSWNKYVIGACGWRDAVMHGRPAEEIKWSLRVKMMGNIKDRTKTTLFTWER